MSDAAVKMMEKMGWQAGQGLGQAGQGRTAPIEVVQREKGAGLGAGYTLPVSEDSTTATYKDRVRRAAAIRYDREDQD